MADNDEKQDKIDEIRAKELKLRNRLKEWWRAQSETSRLFWLIAGGGAAVLVVVLLVAVTR